jgi:hypothetical protein
MSFIMTLIVSVNGISEVYIHIKLIVSWKSILGEIFP